MSPPRIFLDLDRWMLEPDEIGFNGISIEGHLSHKER
jgi:hypothetical protein